ncbi:MAG: glycosyltransferase [Pedobacter sp.]|nr:MAG: glycosyltransferase [Pedobacter sp.]
MNVKDNLMVSICCITYNHKPFIAQTINSFLMQKTNFKFEIVIGDDCSTDGTTAIIKEIQSMHPGRINLLHAPKNMGAHENMRNVLRHCNGKYIALCDGDDFWTKPEKLQKQIDFLEDNLEYVICCHYTKVIDTSFKTLYVHPSPKPLVHTFHDLLIGKQVETKTASVVYRNLPATNQIFQKPWYDEVFAVDKLLKLTATYYTGGKIYVMPEVMSCYRNHIGGIWSMVKAEARMEMVINDFNLIIRHFNYRGIDKIRLLLLYLKRDALFELKRKRFKKVFKTVAYLGSFS